MQRRLFPRLTAGLIVVALAGCGGCTRSTSGIASQAPQTILNSTVGAANGLRSVHAAGSITSSGERVDIDLHLEGGVGGRGQISLNGLTFKLVGLANVRAGGDRQRAATAADGHLRPHRLRQHGHRHERHSPGRRLPPDV